VHVRDDLLVVGTNVPVKNFVGLALALIAACAPEQTFVQPELLGGQQVAPEVLNSGRLLYQEYCRACHGDEGDGRGPAAYSYWPPPRDFRSALFKFAGVSEGDLPGDAELIRVVRHGLNGTAMLPWDLADDEIGSIVQYIKTFSPDKKGFRHPRKKPVSPEIPADPFAVMPAGALWDDRAFAEWASEQARQGAAVPTDPQGIARWRQDKRAQARARQAEAISRGEERYHSGGCQLCHPAYSGPDQLARWGGQLRASVPFDPEPKFSRSYGVVLVPPDFLRHRVRSAIEYRDEAGALHYDPRDFYRVIASGIPGTAMPSWAALPAEEVWSVAYYVADLAQKRDTPQARQLRDSLLGMHPAPRPSGDETPPTGPAQ
jgi:mono/diheme cytochrome c family protein